MRKTPNSHHFHLPSLHMPTELQFSPVYAEDDELIQAIETEAERRDDMWRLEATPDAEGLQQFWSNVSIDD